MWFLLILGEFMVKVRGVGTELSFVGNLYWD